MPIDTFTRRTATITRDDGARYTYSFLDEAPPHGTNSSGSSGATILAVHGFPDLAISYSRQIRAWTAAGHRVIVPDCLGYGATVRTPAVFENSVARHLD